MNKVKQIKQPKLTFKKDTSAGRYTPLRKTINISYEECIYECDKYNIDIITYIMDTISHEFLHCLLYIEHNFKTSEGLDKLIFIQTGHIGKQLKKYTEYGMW